MKPVDSYRIALTAFKAHQYYESIEILEALFNTLSPLQESAQLKPFLSLEDFLIQLLKNPPDSIGFWQKDLYFDCGMLLAITLKKNQQIPQAIEVLTTLNSHYKNSLQLIHLLGRYMALEGHYEEAIFHLTKLIRLSPQYGAVYQDLAWISNQSGNFLETIQLIQVAMKTAPGEKLFEYLLIALAELEDQEAIEDTILELCLQYLSEATFPVLLTIAQRFFQKKNYQKTIALTHQLFDFDPLNQECTNMLVMSLLKKRNFSKACYYLLKSLSYFQKSPENWYKLGVVYQHWNMPLFARHALAKGLEYASESSRLYHVILHTLNDIKISINLEDCVKSIIKRCTLDFDFAKNLSQDIHGTLELYGINCTPELENIISKMNPNFIRKVN